MHTTTGLRLLRALAEHGEPVPAYLEPEVDAPARSSVPARPTREAAAAARSERTPR